MYKQQQTSTWPCCKHCGPVETVLPLGGDSSCSFELLFGPLNQLPAVRWFHEGDTAENVKARLILRSQLRHIDTNYGEEKTVEKKRQLLR